MGNPYSEVEFLARSRGIYVDPDAELCRKQMEELRAGIIRAQIDTNIYGFHVRDTHNMGGGRLSPNFVEIDECIRWADDWVAQNPTKHFLYPTGWLTFAPDRSKELRMFDAPLA